MRSLPTNLYGCVVEDIPLHGCVVVDMPLHGCAVEGMLLHGCVVVAMPGRDDCFLFWPDRLHKNSYILCAMYAMCVRACMRLCVCVCVLSLVNDIHSLTF